MKLYSRFVKSRHGIYYLRLQISGVDKRWSLGTRDPLHASITAHKIGAKILSMKIDPTKIKGWTLKTDGNNIELQTENNDADRLSAKEALVAYMHANNHVQADNFQNKPQEDRTKTKLFTEAIAEYALHLPTTDLAVKTQNMTLSQLRRLSTLLGVDFDTSLLTRVNRQKTTTQIVQVL